MLIPIGHERESVRRVPLVTLAIIGVCLAIELVFQWAEIPTQRQLAEVDRAFRPVVALWTQHPDLETPENFDRVAELLSADQQRMLQELPPASGSPDISSAQLALQEQFDALWKQLLAALPDNPRAAWGFHTMEPSMVQALTSMFVHADWSHVLWNMFFLFTCAVLLEDVWGRGCFLGFYLLAGLAASVPEMIVFAATPTYSLGASGAIAAVMGAFAVRFWNVRMRILLPLWLGARRVWLSSWVFPAFWFARNVVSIGEELDGGGIARMAHVAGFAFGAAVAFAFRFLHVEERYLAAADESRSSRTIVSNPAIDRSIEDVGRNRQEVAWRRLADAVQREPENVDAALALWRVSRELGLEAEAAEAMTRAIRVELRVGHVDNATDHWRELVDHVPQITLDAGSLIRISEQLGRRGYRAEAAETLRNAFENSARSATGATLLRLATVAEELDPELSEVAARVALEHPDSDPTVKHAASELLSRVTHLRLTVSG